MALVPMGGSGGGMDPRYRQMMAAQLIGNAIGGFGAARDQQKQKAALGQLLTGKPAEMGAGLSGGPAGLDPKLAGPALAMTQGGMAKPAIPGLLETGQLTPQMAQAYMLQGGDPAALASMMPQQMDPYQQAKLGIDTQKLELERQKMAQPPGPQSGIGKVMADFGLDPSNPEHVQRASEIMKSSSAGTNVDIKMPAPYPAAPQGMHYEGDFSTGNVALKPTPGHQPEISGDAARNAALAPGAVADIQSITGALMGPSGEVDRGLVTQMYLNVPGTQGRTLRAQLERAIDLMVVNRTGASATPEQMASYWRGYAPSPLDSSATVQEKLNAFLRDIGSAKTIAQRGRGDVPEPTTQPQAPVEPTLMDQLVNQGVGMVEQGVGAVQGMMGGPAPAQAAPPPAAAPASQGQVGEGTIATNPQTGQSLILRNGQWVPL